MKKFTKLLKKIAFIVITIYASITMFNQQKLLNSYATTSNNLQKQIEEAKNEQEELNQTKENATSEEYIEKMAREKLDMYKPNERVYVDSEK